MESEEHSGIAPYNNQEEEKKIEDTSANNEVNNELAIGFVPSSIFPSMPSSTLGTMPTDNLDPRKFPQNECENHKPDTGPVSAPANPPTPVAAPTPASAPKNRLDNSILRSALSTLLELQKGREIVRPIEHGIRKAKEHMKKPIITELLNDHKINKKEANDICFMKAGMDLDSMKQYLIISGDTEIVEWANNMKTNGSHAGISQLIQDFEKRIGKIQKIN